MGQQILGAGGLVWMALACAFLPPLPARAETAVATAAERRITVREAIAEPMTVETGEEARARLLVLFADGSRLRLAERSRASIDRFTYDPARPQEGALAVTLTQGAAEFESGRLPKHRYMIATPFARISLRGTHFGVDMANEGIFVVEGETLARFLTGETLSLRPSECTFRGATGRTQLTGLACAESTALSVLARLLQARPEPTPADLELRERFLRLPSTDANRVPSPN